MDDYIERQHFSVERAEKKLFEATERLKQVRIERKTHETLKEKAFQQFLADEKRQEGKEVDELTTAALFSPMALRFSVPDKRSSASLS